MQRRSLVFASIAFILSIANSSNLFAAQRTFVASYGADSNSCSLTAPCRGFQAAIDAVAPGGEVVALDSGGYGAMEIHKSVSVIVPPGVHAGLSPLTGIPLPGYPGQFGVVLIDIQDTDIVVLRGLHISHQGTVTGGIEWISNNAGTVHLENVVVSGFPYEGLYMQSNPSNPFASVAHLYVKDSIFRNNQVGIYGALWGEIHAHRVRIEGSDVGVNALGGTGTLLVATLIDSDIANGRVGVQLDSVAGHLRGYLDRCTVVRNQFAYNIDSGSGTADFELAGTIFTENGPPVTIGGAGVVVISWGNNSGPASLHMDSTTAPF